MEISNNGASQPQAAMVTSSWVRDDYASGRRRYKLYAMHVPLVNAQAADKEDGINSVITSHPRLASGPTVIGEATLDVPNLEVAKILLAGLAEMLNKQPPEILQVGGRN